MTAPELQGIANAIVRRAERQGYVVPRDIRAELASAGLAEEQWKEVVALARESLNYRHGRYYYVNPVSPRLQEAQNQRQTIQSAIRLIIDAHRAREAQLDRRHEDRIDFVQQVQVHTEDGRKFQLLSRDLSPTGIRLIGTRSLLGQKVRVLLPQADGAEPLAFLVRILWTGAIGDELFENGGSFLEMVTTAANP